MIQFAATLKSRIPLITAAASSRASSAVEKTVFDIQAGCQVRSRVDTGQMRDGWQGEMLDEHTGAVYNSVAHSVHNELGTESMPAQPMLGPSVEDAEQGFRTAMGDVYR